MDDAPLGTILLGIKRRQAKRELGAPDALVMQRLGDRRESSCGGGVAVIPALFPITSSLHVKASLHNADTAMGQVLAVAASGQLAGPLIAGAIAQAAGLRTGLLILPILTLLAAGGLYFHHRSASPDGRACPVDES